MSRIKNPYSKRLDGFFLPILDECRKFLTLNAYKVVYTELDEAMRISDISRVLIFSDEDEQGIEDGSNINPGYKPYDEGEVILFMKLD
jgi:hypothetical protein